MGWEAALPARVWRLAIGRGMPRVLVPRQGRQGRQGRGYLWCLHLCQCAWPVWACVPRYVVCIDRLMHINPMLTLFASSDTVCQPRVLASWILHLTFPERVFRSVLSIAQRCFPRFRSHPAWACVCVCVLRGQRQPHFASSMQFNSIATV